MSRSRTTNRSTSAAEPPTLFRSAPDRYEGCQRDLDEVDGWHAYHAPSDRQKALLDVVRGYTVALSRFLVMNLKPSRERSIALTELRAARMLCNQAVVFDPDPEEVA